MPTATLSIALHAPASSALSHPDRIQAQPEPGAKARRLRLARQSGPSSSPAGSPAGHPAGAATLAGGNALLPPACVVAELNAKIGSRPPTASDCAVLDALDVTGCQMAEAGTFYFFRRNLCDAPSFVCDNGCMYPPSFINDNMCDCAGCEDEQHWSCETCASGGNGCPSAPTHSHTHMHCAAATTTPRRTGRRL